MPRTRGLSPEAKITTAWNMGGFAVWREERMALPLTFTATVDDPALPFLIEIEAAVVHGRPVCRRLTASSREDGEEVFVTNALLRAVPIESIVTAAAKRVASPATISDSGELVLTVLAPSGSEDASADAIDRAVERIRRPAGQQRRSRRGGERERLRADVVALYRLLLHEGDPAPRNTIADRVGYTAGYVGRLLWEARKAGELGQARPGVAAEIVTTGEDTSSI